MIFCAFLACPKHILDDSVPRNGRNKTVFVARCNSFLIILNSLLIQKKKKKKRP